MLNVWLFCSIFFTNKKIGLELSNYTAILNFMNEIVCRNWTLLIDTVYYSVGLNVRFFYRVTNIWKKNSVFYQLSQLYEVDFGLI